MMNRRVIINDNNSEWIFVIHNLPLGLIIIVVLPLSIAALLRGELCSNIEHIWLLWLIYDFFIGFDDVFGLKGEGKIGLNFSAGVDEDNVGAVANGGVGFKRSDVELFFEGGGVGFAGACTDEIGIKRSDVFI